ncbi:adaptor complexes medium subunit family protein [Besnoitia besnoiti]|uniref:Coatomer subunit delta n=1 Tax=Besnoitia besnoiti TaxID=94643 RepID=A0A2A9MD00_BESBE|nr:adaptor complexes medium subunit family protein [Besnoitia besnoiti]PFH33826.1 adaptor complexes medium subunit family protein [Besnoitia besnoiti]
MTVISACIMSRQKPLLARQFVEISKVRIEGLMNAFLKLVEHAGADHTYVESDCVRYVYQPLDNVYLVLITTKQSNILEDLQTLRVFATIVQDACSREGLSGGVNVEQVVLENAFSIVFMVDELISFGLREALTLAQIRTFTDMDSHEEKLQRIIQEGKEKEEKERRRQIAQRLDKERAASAKTKPPSSQGPDSSFLSSASSLVSSPNVPSLSAAADYINMYGGSLESLAALSSANAHAGPSGARLDGGSAAPSGYYGGSACGAAPGRGMQLGPQRAAPLSGAGLDAGAPHPVVGVGAFGAQGATGPERQAGAPGADAAHLLGPRADADEASALAAAVGGGPAGAPTMVNPLVEPVQALIEEKVKGTLQAEGGVDELDIQGTFFVTVYDPNKAGLAAFRISPEDRRFKTKVHPNMNRASYAQNVLELRDPTRAYAPRTPAAILKWRLQTKDEGLCPMAISCWPSVAPNGVTLTVEVEATEPSRVLHDVHFSFTCPGNVPHQVLRVDGGETQHDGMSLHWRLPQMSASGELATATLEFFAATDINTVLPFSAEMRSTESICAFDVLECYHMEKAEPIAYALTRRTDYMLTIRA